MQAFIKQPVWEASLLLHRAVFNTMLGLQATNGKDSSLGLGGKGSAGKAVLGTRHQVMSGLLALHTMYRVSCRKGVSASTCVGSLFL